MTGDIDQKRRHAMYLLHAVGRGSVCQSAARLDYCLLNARRGANTSHKHAPSVASSPL